MTSHFNGPILNQDKGGARGLFGNMPMAVDPDYTVFYDDFRKLDAALWTTVKDSGASAAVVADALHGEVALTSAATTENDGASIQTTQESWKAVAGKETWFEAKVKAATVAQLDAVVGFTLNFVTNPEAALTATDRVCFQINDGDASIICKTERNGTETSTDSGVDAVDATYVKLGIRIVGGVGVEFYVDRKLVAAHATNIVTDENLAVALMELSGQATGTQSMSVDYVLVVAQR